MNHGNIILTLVFVDGPTAFGNTTLMLACVVVSTTVVIGTTRTAPVTDEPEVRGVVIVGVRAGEVRFACAGKGTGVTGEEDRDAATDACMV